MGRYPLIMMRIIKCINHLLTLQNSLTHKSGHMAAFVAHILLLYLLDSPDLAIPQHDRLIRPQSHFLPIPAKRIIIVECDLILLYIVRKLIDRSMLAEVGTYEKPFILIGPAVGDDPSVFVVVFLRVSF